MGNIVTLKDYQIVGGMCDTEVYPTTTTSAVLSKDSEGNDVEGVENTLEERLQVIEAKLKAVEEMLSSLESYVLSSEQVTDILNAEA